METVQKPKILNKREKTNQKPDFEGNNAFSYLSRGGYTEGIQPLDKISIQLTGMKL